MDSKDVFIPIERWADFIKEPEDDRLETHIKFGRAQAVGRRIDSSERLPSLVEYLNVLPLKTQEQRLALFRTPKVLTIWLCWNSLLAINWATSQINDFGKLTLTKPQRSMIYWYERTFEESWDGKLDREARLALRLWARRNGYGVPFMPGDPQQIAMICYDVDAYIERWLAQGLMDPSTRAGRRPLNKLRKRCQNLALIDREFSNLPEFGGVYGAE